MHTAPEATTVTSLLGRACNTYSPPSATATGKRGRRLHIPRALEYFSSLTARSGNAPGEVYLWPLFRSVTPFEPARLPLAFLPHVRVTQEDIKGFIFFFFRQTNAMSPICRQ